MTLRPILLSLFLDPPFPLAIAVSQPARAGGRTLDEWVELTQTHSPIQHSPPRPTGRIGLDDGYAEYAPCPARAIATGLGLALNQ